ncbi:MAG: lytic transglycosylase domain-containing protein [Bacillota bacterium]|nr:lytic transglycosylase domain-containing protein [Bacillota bacterium]
MVVLNLRHLRWYLVALLIISSILYFLQAKWFWKLFYPWPYRQEIMTSASRFQLDPHVLAALIRVESRFDPHAQSAAGARGLMQVMPNTAAWVARQIGLQDFHPDLLYQPEVNLLIGSWYLSHLLQEFQGNLPASLAAYNAGRGNVRAWLKTGQWKGTSDDLQRVPFPETQVYLRSVLRDYEIYKYLYGEEHLKGSRVRLGEIY